MVSLNQMNFRNIIILLPALLFIAACAQINTPKLEKNQNFSGKPPSFSYRGQIWREPLVDMEFVWVEGGCFEMGQSDSEKKHLLKESGGIKYDN